MNIDFSIPASPKAARKLVQASKLMKVNLDDAIVSLAAEQYLSDQALKQKIGDDVSQKHLDLCRFADDHSYRFVAGFSKASDPWRCLMNVIKVSDQPTVIVANNDLNYSSWFEFLTDNQIEFLVLNADADLKAVLESKIVLTKHSDVKHDFVNNNRHRIVVSLTDITLQIKQSSGPQTLTELYNTVMNSYGTLDSLNLNYEFQKVISGFYINEPQNDGLWWENYKLKEMTRFTHPGLNINRILSLQPHTQNDLMKMGFILRHPEQIAPLLGINVSFL